MKSILLALCLFAAPLSAQEGVSVADIPDTTASIVTVDNTVIIGLMPIDSAYHQLAEYLYGETQKCVQVEKPYEDLAIFTAYVIYDVEVDPTGNNAEFVPLQQLLGMFYYDPFEIIVALVDTSPLQFAQTLTHEFVHYLEPAWNEKHVADANAACWQGSP